MADVLVCKDQWNGVKKEQFNWHNNTPNTVQITQVAGSTWPFTLSSPITVNPNSKVACGLIDQTGTFPYTAAPCSTLGNPKNVIIT